MLRSLAVAIGAVAVAAIASAVVLSSGVLFVGGIAGAITAGAFLRADQGRRADVPGDPDRTVDSDAPSANRTVDSDASSATDTAGAAETGDPGSSPPSVAACPGVDGIVAPASLDVAGVADALLASSASAGHVVYVSVWERDGASGDPIRVAAAGSGTGVAGAERAAIDSALSSGTSVLESFTVGGGAEDPVTHWRYAVPVAFGGTRGVAAVDFERSEPDAVILNRIAASFRLPLAAALALSTARKESESARALLESARDLSRMLDENEIVSGTLRRALDLTRATTGSIMLYDEDVSSLRIVASVGLPSDVVRDTAVRAGDGIAGWVALSGQPLVVEDLPGRTTPARSRGVRSAVSVPIHDDGGVLGVLNVGSRTYPSKFTTTDLTALEGLARHSAVALRNARAMASAGEIYFDTLRALSLALETKDPYALGGTDRVLEYARALGEAMGLRAEEARALDIAAMLHDIGMSSVGEVALVTQRPLSTVERGMLKMHPVIAAEILEQAPALREVAPIVYHHHEHYDGSGYVGGVRGEAIPIGARILSVADAFVAMTSERPHRQALPESEAVNELRANAGTQFDPAVVDAFVSIVMADRNRVRSGDSGE